MAGDTVHLASQRIAGSALLQPVMRGGRRLQPSPTLAQVRDHHAAERARLPAPLSALGTAAEPYPVAISVGLRDLAAQVDAATSQHAARDRV